MTVIAYRDGVMACDSCWNDRGTIDTLGNKIVRLKSGALLGQSGDNDVRELIGLLQHVKTPQTLPSRSQLIALRADFDGLLVFKKNRIFRIATTCKLIETLEEEDIGVWEISRPFAAIGSGGDFALGALAAGKSAREAAALACRFNINCRLPVYAVAL